ncbi:MAG TPA: DUF4956 domain-containing protein [Actinotalea sp.]
MSHLLAYLADLAAVAVMVLGLYLPRHGRRDLVAAYLAVNVGVLAVTAALSSSGVGAGVGLGLFGVLSIIRLRSTELGHDEVAYYFSALALGLLGGLDVTPTWLTLTLMAAIVAVLHVGDHPRVLAGRRSQVMVLDRALVDERSLRDHLEGLIGVPVDRVTVLKVDLVLETTQVDVRYRLSGRAPGRDSWPSRRPMLTRVRRAGGR